MQYPFFFFVKMSNQHVAIKQKNQISFPFFSSHHDSQVKITQDKDGCGHELRFF